VVTVLKNGSTTTITCFLAAAQFCYDGSHPVTTVPGDLISIQIATGASETAANIKATVLWF